MKENLDLSIIIVNWFSCEYTIACIKSIVSGTRYLNYEIIVVDNASYDDTKAVLEKEYKDVIFIQSEINGGFAYANNLGAKHATGAGYLFLNPDTEIYSGSLEKTFELLKNNGIGIIGCKLLNSDKSVQTSCIQALPTIKNQILDADFLRKNFRNSNLWGNAVLWREDIKVAEVEAVSGAFLMIRSDCFEKLKGFDQEYFMYGEDMDLCNRLRKKGYKVFCDKRLTVIHHGGGSTIRRSENRFSNITMRNSLYRYFLKNHSRLQANSYRIAMFVCAVLRITCGGLLLPLVSPNRRGNYKEFFNKWATILIWSVKGEKIT